MKIPRLTVGKPIITEESAHLRDPSCLHFWEGEWHCYMTRVPLEKGKRGGYWGTVRHYASTELEGPWKDRGEVVPLSADPDAFDSFGTFTPDIIKDEGDGKYYLFYDAVKTGFTTEHTLEGFKPCRIGLAVSDSPDGPFRKSVHNPILTVGRKKSDYNGLRIDEPMPLVIGGERRLYFRSVGLRHAEPFGADKTVCLSYPQAGWDSSYELEERNPLEHPPQGFEGFEGYAYFPGPDGLLHMTSVTAWGNSEQGIFHHHLSEDGIRWDFEGTYPLIGGDGDFRTVPAPHPVWKPGSLPGDRGEVIAFADQFADREGKMGIRLMGLEWVG